MSLNGLVDPANPELVTEEYGSELSEAQVLGEEADIDEGTLNIAGPLFTDQPPEPFEPKETESPADLSIDSSESAAQSAIIAAAQDDEDREAVEQLVESCFGTTAQNDSDAPETFQLRIENRICTRDPFRGTVYEQPIEYTPSASVVLQSRLAAQERELTDYKKLTEKKLREHQSENARLTQQVRSLLSHQKEARWLREKVATLERNLESANRVIDEKEEKRGEAIRFFQQEQKRADSLAAENRELRSKHFRTQGDVKFLAETTKSLLKSGASDEPIGVPKGILFEMLQGKETEIARNVQSPPHTRAAAETDRLSPTTPRKRPASPENQPNSAKCPALSRPSERYVEPEPERYPRNMNRNPEPEGKTRRQQQREVQRQRRQQSRNRNPRNRNQQNKRNRNQNRNQNRRGGSPTWRSGPSGSAPAIQQMVMVPLSAIQGQPTFAPNYHGSFISTSNSGPAHSAPRSNFQRQRRWNGPAKSRWQRDLTMDGDVESNPGPTSPGILLLLVAMFLKFEGIRLETGAAHPMLCQSHEGKQIFTLPAKIPCSATAPTHDKSEVLIPTEVALYKRNHIQYKSEAWACKKVKVTVRSITYFFVENRMREVEKKQVPTSAEECKRMSTWHTCKEGPLTTKGDLWQTQHEVDMSYPGGLLECCKWRVREATNCFMYKAYVYKRHNSAEMESTVGSVSHCDYQKGFCQLKDGTYLVWTPNANEQCQFLPWKGLHGQRFGTNWLSSDGNLALTHSVEKYTEDCNGKRLLMSEQGIPFYYVRTPSAPKLSPAVRANANNLKYAVQRRRRRTLRKRVTLRRRVRTAAYQEGGPVPTEVLAASLQALNFDLHNSIKFAFLQAMSTTCRAMTTIVDILKANILSNPTLAMRTLLKRPNIIARAGGHAIEVWPCAQLAKSTYHFLPMNGTCTNEIPVQFSVSGEIHHGYMDPRTNIIHKRGYPTDCTLNEEIPIRMENKTLLYHGKTGETEPAPHISELQLVSFNMTEFAPVLPTIFHQIVMYNWSELQSHVTLNDLMGTLSAQQQLLQELGVRDQEHPQIGAQQAIASVVQQGFFGFLRGLGLDPMQIWVFCCCVVVTATVMFRFCCPSALNQMQFSAPLGVLHLVDGLTDKLRQAHQGIDAIRRQRRSPLPSTRERDEDIEMSPPIPPRPVITIESPPPYDSQVSSSSISPERTTVRVIQTPSPRNILRSSMRHKPSQLVAMVFSDGGPRGPTIPVKVAEESVSAFVDTGASVSLLDRAFADRLCGILGSPDTELVSLSSHRIPVISSLFSSVNVCAKEYFHEFQVVENLPVACVLGVDFLAKINQVYFRLSQNAHEPHLVAPVLQAHNVLKEPEGEWKPFLRTDRYYPLIEASIAGVKAVTLADTGATLSLMSESLARKLDVQWGPPQVTAASMSSHALKLTASATIPVQVGNLVVEQLFHVLQDSPNECLLGTDFLSKFDVVGFNFSTGCLNLAGQSIPFLLPPANQQLKLIVDETVEIAPRSETHLAARVQGSPCLPLTVLVEPESKVSEEKGLYVARTLNHVNEKGKIVARILNPLPYPVILYRNMRLGSVEPAAAVAAVTATQEQDSNQTDFVEAPDLSHADIDAQQKTQLLKLLAKFQDVFAQNDFDLGRSNLIKHHIDTGNHPPIRSRPYRIPEAQKELVREHVQQMLDHGIIQPSVSAWSFPIVLVKKKSGEDRFCIDYRRLNAATKRDEHPLPRIDEILDSLGNARIFSTLDLASGYWQVEMDPASKEKTAFTCFLGLYEFNVLPFGLTNAPPGFQRMMGFVLSGLEWEFALVYLDDCIIFSPSFELHLDHLEAVFLRFRRYNLKLKMRKCHFCQASVEFLGHLVTKDGVRPHPDKVKAITEFPTPKTTKNVRQLIGMASYYRRFIPGFAKIAAPLHKLTTKEASFSTFYWSPECQKAADELKRALTSKPILAYPDFKKPFLLETDASDIGIGAVLSQIQDDGLEHPVAYASRILQKAEKKYCAPEKEALAIVWGYENFRPYLYGREFEVKSDHQPLRWLMEVEKPNSRLQRWGLALQEARIKGITYKPGPQNKVPDALSRNPVESVAMVCATLLRRPPHSIANVCAAFPGVPTHFKTLQREDAELSVMINFLESNKLPDGPSEAKNIKKIAADFQIVDGLLYHNPPRVTRTSLQFPLQLVIPKSFQNQIMEIHHDDVFGGHLGFEKTLSRINQRFYWTGMRKDIEEYCKQCQRCQTKKHPHEYIVDPLQPLPVSGPFDRVAVDVLGPMHITESGNKYLIVFSDYLTKFVEVFPAAEISAKTTAKLFVEGVVCRHGSPVELLSDCAKNFLSSVLQEVCQLLDTRKTNTTPYHPACNGLVERFNKTLTHMLSMFCSTAQNDWDSFLPFVLFAYHTTKHSTTGETPAFLLYGRDLRLPSDLAFQCSLVQYTIYDENYASFIRVALSEARGLAREHIKNKQEQQKRQHDKAIKPIEINIGDAVYVHTPVQRPGYSKKFFHEWHGPFMVIAVNRPVLTLKDPAKQTAAPFKVHTSRVKCAPPRLPAPVAPPFELDETAPAPPQAPPADTPDAEGEKESESPDPAPPRYNLRSRPVHLVANVCETSFIIVPQLEEQWTNTDERELKNLHLSAGCIAETQQDIDEQLQNAEARATRLREFSLRLQQHQETIARSIEAEHARKQRAWFRELEEELQDTAQGNHPRQSFETRRAAFRRLIQQFRERRAAAEVPPQTQPLRPRLQWGHPFFNRVFTPALQAANSGKRGNKIHKN